MTDEEREAVTKTTLEAAGMLNTLAVYAERHGATVDLRVRQVEGEAACVVPVIEWPPAPDTEDLLA